MNKKESKRKSNFKKSIKELPKDVLGPFFITTFIVFSLLYLLPGSKDFQTNIIWPFSYVVWFYDFFVTIFSNTYILEAYFITFQLIFGSIAISSLIVLLLFYLSQFGRHGLYNVLNRILKISSGFHVLIISILVFKFFPSVRYASPLNLLFLFILALGNGSLSEYYNSIESEFEKILQKEYILAGVAWGHSLINIGRRDFFIVFIESLNARIPIIFSSTIIVEYLFNMRGVSYLVFESIKDRNYEFIMLTTALISLTIIIFSFINDRIRIALDPRAS
ncbi:ABC transporter permease subunit [bacterium]|nr:ABC transporter permease subunit [bacterium]